MTEKIYGSVTAALLQDLISVVGRDNVLTGKESLEDYSHDEMAPDTAVTHYPDVVVKPADPEQISKIMKIADANRIPVTPRGGGTGLCGGAVPIFGGIVVSLERMNRILEIDEDNLMMTAEAGAPFLRIYEALSDSPFFFPPHPGDESAHIGGAAATNAGGARTVKYGVLRDFIKGAELVLANGDILQVGGKLMKNNTGYNLLQLLVGSEGTLGIFTKITLRLLPKAREQMILLLPFNSVEEAITTVPAILKRGIIPLGVEYVEKECLEPTEQLLGLTWPAQGKAFLMIVVVGDSEEELYRMCEEVEKIGVENGAQNALLADRRSDQDVIMNLRSNIYQGLKKDMLEIIDVAVPPKMIAQYVRRVKEVAAENGVWLPVFGHAADGNVHVHIMKMKTKTDWKPTYLKVKKQLFEIVKAMNGVITAEHGVGAQKIPDLHYTLSDRDVELMRGIKRVFDPHNILNPGKVLPM